MPARPHLNEEGSLGAPSVRPRLHLHPKKLHALSYRATAASFAISRIWKQKRIAITVPPSARTVSFTARVGVNDLYISITAYNGMENMMMMMMMMMVMMMMMMMVMMMMMMMMVMMRPSQHA